MTAPPIVIDSDTASDDAVAIAMALRHSNADVLAITTVAGNCSVEQATRNALYTAELCHSDVPVFEGSAAPLSVPPEFATWFHGRDGLGDRGYPPPARAAERTDGVTALIDVIRSHPGCTLVTLGPLTNVALALSREPALVGDVGRCVVMGGTNNSVGNVTPAAEFNLWFDPHAARAVFAAGLPIEMAGWDLCRGHAGLTVAEQRELAAASTLGRFFVECNAKAIEAIAEQSGSERLELPDPTAMAVALERDRVVLRSSRHHVEVEAASTLTRGMSVVDSLDVTGRAPNTEVIWEIDVDRFKQMLVDAATA